MKFLNNARPLLNIFAALLLIGVFITSCEQVNTPIENEQTLDEATGSFEGMSVEKSDKIPDQYIVVFNQEVDNVSGEARALVQRNNGRLLHVYSHALKGFSANLSSQAASALGNLPQVASVEQDLIAHAIAQELPTGIDRIDADQNSTANIDNNDDPMDVDIAILDTGSDPDHPDLNVKQFDNFTDDPDDDGNGHGTHVAGTAAALDNNSQVVGVAPGARIWAIKVLDDSGSGSFSDIIAGIDLVTENADKIEVANMSLGAQGQLDVLRTAIQNSVAAGVVYVVAAGNSGADVYGSDGTFDTSDDFIPAAYPEVATVSAMADFDGSSGGDGGRNIFSGCGPIDDDTIADCFTNFSSTVVSTNPVNSPGAAIDLAAPGVSILSTWEDGGTNTISGTSMSSPHVAGAAALYIAENERAYNAEEVYAIRQALIDNGQPQSQWRSGETKDPDGNLEPMVFVGVLSTPSSETDIAITDVSAPSSVTQGDDVNIDVTVENIGDEDAGSDITVILTDETDGVEIGTQTISGGLAAGESVILTYSWNTDNSSAGDHTITASHDFSDDNSGNDSKSTTVTVDEPITDGDVVVDSIEPNSMAAGSTIDVTITGSGFASGADVTFENGSGPAPEASNIEVGDDSNTIDATVTTKSGGPPRDRVWDVVVTNSDGSSGILSDGFTVTAN